MTLAHQDIRERLVDYLFGELDEPARAAFDQHLAGCESCRATVEATAKARAMAREVVRAPLDEPVPLGLRSRVLAAAAAAAEERRAAASTTTVAAAAAAAIAAAGSPPSKGKGGSSAETSSGSGEDARARAGAPRPGWFDWLRGRWAFPTFATVAAMAAFFLFRGTILREARHPLGDDPAEKLGLPSSGPPSGAKPEAPVPAARDVKGQLAPDPEGKAAERVVGVRAASDVQRGAGKGQVAASGSLEPERRGGVERSRRKAAAPAASRGAAEGSLHGLAQPAPGRGADREAEASRATRPPAAKPAARPMRAALEDGAGPPREAAKARNPAKADLEKLGARADDPLGFAAPPPPVPAVAPSGRSAAAGSTPADRDEPAVLSAERAADKKAKKGQKEQKTKEAEESRTRSANEAPAAESAQDDEGSPGAPTRVERAPAPVARPVSGAPAPSAASSAPAAPADPARALAQRADQLLAARRWTEASAAYRDLLRRFPDHPSVPQWRTRLAAADRASSDAGFATPPPPR